jgi:hypothetical protein
MKEDEMGGAYSVHGEMRNVYKILVGKPEGKRRPGISRHRWNNIKMDLTEIGIPKTAIFIRAAVRTSNRTRL